MSEKKLDIVKVEFEIGKFAVDFIKEYLAFIGSSDTIEDVAREAFFEGICTLRDKLTDLPFQQRDDFFKKHGHIALLDSWEQQKRVEEMERQTDC